MKVLLKPVPQLLLLTFLSLVSLQLFFLSRIALMAFVAPESTSFERSNLYQIATDSSLLYKVKWRQDWVNYDHISQNLKRAIIASEDATFIDHDGVDWTAIEKAWDKNQKAEKIAERNKPKSSKLAKPTRPPKTVGGSTITQQLAKNLFLSGERTYVRKGQEFVLVFMLETLLSKQRIYEIYLNNVEWGEGVFGANAASQYYFHKTAAQLSAEQASTLAVMLPRPKYFEKRIFSSDYLHHQASTIEARMADVDIP